MVVLIGGGAIAMPGWIESARYYACIGEAGTAPWPTFFGEVNRRDAWITFPMSEGQLPLYYNHKPTGRGR